MIWLALGGMIVCIWGILLAAHEIGAFVNDMMHKD